MMYLSEALSVLLANKIRSLLTITGLVIGVGAVIAIQVLGQSMAGAVGGALGAMSDDSFFIQPKQNQASYSRALITKTDLADLGSLPNVALAIPLMGATDLVQHGHAQARYYLTGDAVNSINNGPLQNGRRFTQDEVDEGANVCVISNRAYKKLFPRGGDPVGESIYAGIHRYLIVGVLAPPRTGILNATFGGDILVPYTTMERQYMRGDQYYGARFIVHDAGQLTATEAAVIHRLRQLHGNPNLQYSTFDKAQLTQGINGIFGVITLAVGVIGAVSLLVAGIGIMNIMLVSVTERTREIGVRKAIGARRGQILVQFFVEALLLCGFGCAIGLAIGMGIGAAVNSFAIVKLTGYTAPLPWVQSLLIAAGFAAVSTLAFGTYPAYRAAQLDPIEALRYE